MRDDDDDDDGEVSLLSHSVGLEKLIDFIDDEEKTS